MNLYLLRHGDAAPGHPDDTRPLTEKGEEDIRKLTSILKKKKAVRVDRVCVSPLLRAQQTADLFLDGLGIEAQREIDPGLIPEANPARTAREALEAQLDLLLIGHNPHLELLASYLLTGRSNGAMMVISTGSLLCLENTHIRPDIGACMLRWMISPKVLKSTPA